MARQYDHDHSLLQVILSLILITCLFYAGLWYSDKSRFLIWLLFFIVTICVLGIIYVFLSDYLAKRNTKKQELLLHSIDNLEVRTQVLKFLNTVGLEEKKQKNKWVDGIYSFTWEQLGGFMKTLHDLGIPLSLHNYSDITYILKYFINR